MDIEPSIAQLRNFLRVAQHGSFHTAADEAFRSQPAISKSIHALEDQLGKPLFEPSQRTQLTPFGQACEASVRETLLQYDRTVGMMLSLARSEIGLVTVAAIGGLASNWLPEIVSGLISKHPQVRIQLLDDNTQNIAQMLLRGEVDLGLCASADDPKLLFTPLLADDFGLICREDHPLASRKSVRWSELKDLRLASTTAHRQLGNFPERLLLEGKTIEVFNMLTLLSLLEQGVAQTVLPLLALPKMIPGLKFIPLTTPRRQREIGILNVRNRTLSPAAAVVAEMIRGVARRNVGAHVRKVMATP